MAPGETYRPEEVLAEDKGYLQRIMEEGHDEHRLPAPRPAAKGRAIT